MCVGDWRLGRFIRSQTSFLSVAAGFATVLPPSPQRVGIYFSVSVTNSGANLSMGTGGAGDPILVSINPTLCQYLISLKDHGDLSTKRWHMENDGLNTICAVTEFFLPEEMLAEAYNHFNSGFLK